MLILVSHPYVNLISGHKLSFFFLLFFKKPFKPLKNVFKLLDSYRLSVLTWKLKLSELQSHQESICARLLCSFVVSHVSLNTIEWFGILVLSICICVVRLETFFSDTAGKNIHPHIDMLDRLNFLFNALFLLIFKKTEALPLWGCRQVHQWPWGWCTAAAADHTGTWTSDSWL